MYKMQKDSWILFLMQIWKVIEIVPFCLKLSALQIYLTIIKTLSYPCTKFVVPSTGSMIQVGLSVSMQGSPAATDSSPMKLKLKEWESRSWHQHWWRENWHDISIISVIQTHRWWRLHFSLTCVMGTSLWQRRWSAAPPSGPSLWPGRQKSSWSWPWLHSAELPW